jgi:protein-S-isoprenylcysteine O-methyltransferase Ste14
MELLYISLFWIIYGLMHSVFASGRVKRTIQRTLRLHPQDYRKLYVVQAIVLLFPLFYLRNYFEYDLLFDTPVTDGAGIFFIIAGLFILSYTFRLYPVKTFIGFGPEENKSLVSSGLLAIVRHPIYLGTVLAFFGWFLVSGTTFHLVSLLWICAYLIPGVYWEEKKLQEQFGEEYTQYKSKVPPVFPRIFVILSLVKTLFSKRKHS